MLPTLQAVTPSLRFAATEFATEGATHKLRRSPPLPQGTSCGQQTDADDRLKIRRAHRHRVFQLEMQINIIQTSQCMRTRAHSVGELINATMRTVSEGFMAASTRCSLASASSKAPSPRGAPTAKSPTRTCASTWAPARRASRFVRTLQVQTTTMRTKRCGATFATFEKQIHRRIEAADRHMELASDLYEATY